MENYNFSRLENETRPSCMIFDGDEYKCDVILAVRKTTAFLSLVGCLFMMLIIWLFRKYALFAHRLILYLTIAAFFGSISYLIEEERLDGPLCDFEAFFVTLWDWAVLTWASCITCNLLMSVIKMITTEKYEIVYHIIGWGLPLFVSLLPFIGDHYGPAGAWCWIKDDKQDVTHWRFAIWYGPLIIILIAMFVAYMYVLWTLKRKVGQCQGTQEAQAQHAERDRKLINKEIRPLVAFPLIYLITSIFAFINRIQNAVNPGHPVFVLVLLQAMTSPMVGAVNAIVYGLDKTTRKKLNKGEIKKSILSRRKGKTSGVVQEYTPEIAAASNETTDPSSENKGDNIMES